MYNKVIHRKFWIVICTLILLAGCKNGKKEISTESGLRYEILKPGSGAYAENGDEVSIHESMEFLDGTIMYNTKDFGGKPVKFKLGQNQVIKGVDEGVRGMQVGEIRKLVVPPVLSKRKVYPNFISPDSTLVYTIELVGVQKPD